MSELTEIEKELLREELKRSRARIRQISSHLVDTLIDVAEGDVDYFKDATTEEAELMRTVQGEFVKAAVKEIKGGGPEIEAVVKAQLEALIAGLS